MDEHRLSQLPLFSSLGKRELRAIDRDAEPIQTHRGLGYSLRAAR